MKTQEQITELQNKVREIADEIGGKVYKSYSGRGMFGEKCMGIDCGNYTECIKAAAEHGLKGARWDNLGLGYIVYWEFIPACE